jgi:phage tail sheath gpL-like
MGKNLTSGQVVPGFFSDIDYNTKGGGSAPNLRLLIWGLIGSSAQRTPNQPFLPADQQDVDDGCQQGSDAANTYAASVSQPESQGAEIWVMPIVEPSGGVVATYKLKVYVANTNPVKSGTLVVWINSEKAAEVGFTPSDTSTTIATALLAALNSNPNLPIGTCTIATDVVTIPFKHKGLIGEDFPIRANISPNASGVTLSPGQALFATNATGAGSVKVSFGALSVSTAIANADTAAVIATKVAASFNADSYPMSAVVDGSTPAQVNFLFANDKDVRRISATVITSTGTTVNLGSGATSGAGLSSSLSYNGTQGVGAPDLTAALANLANLDPFRSHVSPFMDTATIGAMATNIENASDGSISGQKQQTLTLCDFRSSADAGAIAPACSPNLTATAPHYAILRSPDVPVRGVEIAARIAAARSALWIDQPQKNWNGFQVRGNDRKPILLPPTKPSLTAQNTDLRTFGLAPVIKGPSGFLEVVKGRTTSLATDKRLWAWSIEAQAAYHAVDIRSFFSSRFSGGSIVRFSEPKAQGIFDANSFKSAAQERMRFWETNGNFDGADLLADFVDATPDVNNPFRINVRLPESGVLDLDQVVITSRTSSPSA